MNALLIYMVKAAAYLAGFYLIYFIFLSRDTNYNRNRAYLIISVISAMVFPLISVNVREQATVFYVGKTLSEVFVNAERTKDSLVTIPGSFTGFSSLLVKIYLTGFILLALKLAADILDLAILIIRNRKKNDQIIKFSGFNTSGFSAMGYIFINKSLGDSESEEIIRHEENHLYRKHFLDIILIEIIKVFQWFNPFIYLINRSIRAVHEYQADQGCLQSGMSVASYQNLLVKNIFHSGRFRISNSFSNPSLIKKRMLMMIKKPSGKLSNFKTLLVIPVIALFLSIISSCEKNVKNVRQIEKSVTSTSNSNQSVEINREFPYKKVINSDIPPPPPPPVNTESGVKYDLPVDLKKDESVMGPDETEVSAPAEVFVSVEKMPQFPGGDKKLFEFIYANINYPETAKANNIQGKVIVKFCVTYNGGISQVKIIKPIDPDLDKEVLRVIKMLPTWAPGEQGGKPVNVWYIVPVVFQLKN